MKRWLALLHARNLEYMRDRSALIWSFVVPVLLLLAMSFVFKDPNRDRFKVAVVEVGPSIVDYINEKPFMAAISQDDLKKAKKGLETQRFDLIIHGKGSPILLYNASSEKSQLVRESVSDDWRNKGQSFSEGAMSAKPIKYVEWVLSGVLALNMMYSCLYGVGYVIIRYRKNGYLKRLRATPIRNTEFLLAHICSRLIITQCVTSLLFIGSLFLFRPELNISIASLLLMSLSGAFCFISLGVMLSSRGTSEELSRGIIELFAWPMLVLGSVFFSIENVHPALEIVASQLPLTLLVDGARQSLLYDVPLSGILPNVIKLMSIGIVFLGIGVKFFKWHQE